MASSRIRCCLGTWAAHNGQEDASGDPRECNVALPFGEVPNGGLVCIRDCTIRVEVLVVRMGSRVPIHPRGVP